MLANFSESVLLMFRRPRRHQFAALCYRIGLENNKPEILLVTSRDTGRWVIPKGWPMGAKAGHEVAAQEAFEEAGVSGETQRQPLGYFSYDKSMQNGLVLPVRVQVHALNVAAIADDFKEKGKRRVEWFSPEDAESRVLEPELKGLIRRFATGFSAETPA
jgi:8-oxo-dGTP pyrophosphatase MutT (NUDIX family)